MGRLNTTDERKSTLSWARTVKPLPKSIGKTLSPYAIRQAFDKDLKKYFALSCLSRSQTESAALVEEAKSCIFRIRTSLEEVIATSIRGSLSDNGLEVASLFSGKFYGTSKKQGTSMRMPLTTCQPTSVCASACYAHDVLDAAPLSVIRGAVNGVIGSLYEKGDGNLRKEILTHLAPHTKCAVKAARKELRGLPWGFSRRPNIRFAHVGEMACFPCFANDLAKQVRDVSLGEVDCVVYTRHRDARRLDPDLFIVNFTLDSCSLDRRNWVPSWARVTYSAFGGVLAEDVDVNFIEHHRWMHFEPVGRGPVCPATHPTTTVRKCDACRCNVCFTRRHHLSREDALK
jgi:hypothetical protein